MIRIGCSGWSYSHWLGRLYPSTLPPSRWLERYAECFGTVEVNTTFYRLPKRSTVVRWAEITPDNFCFSVKCSRYLTHVRRLGDLPEGVAWLVELLEPLSSSGKLGPLLWQLPPTFRRDDERLAPALAALPRGRHAFEFRDPSWFTEDVYSLLREHKVALVVADRAALPEAPWVDTAGWWYLRFHHGTRGTTWQLLAGRTPTLGRTNRGRAAGRLLLLQQRLGGLRNRQRDVAPSIDRMKREIPLAV